MMKYAIPRSVKCTDKIWHVLKFIAAVKCQTIQMAMNELIEKEFSKTGLIYDDSSIAVTKTNKLSDLDRRLRGLLSGIRTRCYNRNNSAYHCYGGRGIRNYLTVDDLRFLWQRDKASDMQKPSIDRIDNDGNYAIENCRFIEMRFNHRYPTRR